MNKFRLFLLPAFALGLYSAQAQVKVGDNPTNVNGNAIFEMESTNKGVLFPRMALTAANSPSPLSAFVAGMTVYNTATAGSGVNAITPGLYYSDGTKWMPIGKDWAEDQSLGSIAVFPFASVPSTYLICNGQAISRTTYAALYAKIGTTYGAGDGSTTFNLPDLRGEFIRGWDNGRGVDSGRALGSTQAQGTARPTTAFTGTTSTDGAHTHGHGNQPNLVGAGGTANFGYTPGSTGMATSPTTTSAGNHTHTVSITGGGDSETRPRNVAMVYAIKAVESIIVSGSSGSGATYNGSTSVTLNGTSFERAALTGDVTATANSNATTIAANAVTSAKIADGTIVTADVADGAITAAKINQMSATSGQVLKWNGTAWAPAADIDTNTAYTGSTSVALNGTSFERAALTGDVTATTNSNATTIAPNAVTSAKIADGTIVTADVADGAITAAKINQMSATSGQVLKWNGTAWAPAADIDTNTAYTGSTSVALNGTSFERAALTGDVTATTNSNATTIAPNAVTSAKIADGTIVTADLADSSVTTAKIADATVANADLATGAGGIYKGSGSLSGNTTVTMGTNTLGFASAATTGTSHFTVDGNTFNIDAVNNKVGIGTSAPWGRIHLSGDSSGSNYINSSIVSSNTGTGGHTWAFGARPLGTNGDFSISNETDGQIRMTLQGGTGRMGVGTTQPTEKLHVVENSNTPVAMSVTNTSGSGRFGMASAIGSYAAPNVGDVVINNLNGAGGIAFTRGNTVGMYINSSNNVGIGTVTPVGKLEVLGPKPGFSVGTGANSDGPTLVAISSANTSLRYTDWPNSWGGGLSTWDVVGASAYFSQYVTRSDARLKTDVQNINSSIFNNFMKIRPVTYFLK